MHFDVGELPRNFCDMISKSGITATAGPKLVYLGSHIGKNTAKLRRNINLIAKILCQLFNPSFGRIGSNTHDIRIVGNYDFTHS